MSLFVWVITFDLSGTEDPDSSYATAGVALTILYNATPTTTELFHQPTLMHRFLYSLTICLLHYYPRHVSSINMPIFRRKNCIHTASGIFALCKRLQSTLVESGLQSTLNQCALQTFTESEDTRCCVNTIFSPEDGHVNARNISRIIV